ncbi:MAG: 4-alpha-glucanotransferase [Nitrospira sp.]|nr:4-alpha-glucanotransferase [Nitrospira sp.]QOJ34429.1 MAG: 4-alpha-glucanotransferase [Nitrospira sp.]
MYDGTEPELLRLLASRVGIAPDYHDIAGTHHVTGDETARAILSAMGFRAGSRDGLVASLRALDDAAWQQPCDPILLLHEGYQAVSWSLRVPVEVEEEQRVVVAWSIVDEQGTVVHRDEVGPHLPIREVREVDGRRMVRLELPLREKLGLGYYDLAVVTTGHRVGITGALRLVVAPTQCYVPESLQRGGRVWGLAVQLYALRSQTNWGVGDFGDLSRLVEWAGRDLGAGIIGLNPLHALKNTRPHHLSPYSPNSRLFLNDLYIDLEQLPEYLRSDEAQALRKSPEVQEAVERARRSDRVDAETVVQVKRRLLHCAYRQFLQDNYAEVDGIWRPSSERGRLLEAFIRDEGEPLKQFALFHVLEEERSRLDPAPALWPSWQAEYRRPNGPASDDYYRRHRDRIRFVQYVQWVAAEQLGQAKAKAAKADMAVGLYPDLALGSDRNGAEAWMLQEVLALEADCGAPPDAFAPQGQNWGFAPFHPLRLKAAGYRPFIELIRKTFRQGGAIRIDHVMMLFRLFWVPRGMSAAAGAYVYYPAEDLLKILALESVRAGTLVIGEDLGTVPDYVREQLARYKILSYRVFYFERQWDGACKPPSDYPTQSLAVVTTHDLPTLAGYWTGEDIRLRAGLGLYSDETSVRRAFEERTGDKAHILAALRQAGQLPPGTADRPEAVPVMTADLAQAIHAYLASSPAWIVMANLDDMIGEVTQMNLPGTLDAYPNWSRKLSLSLEDLQQDERVHALAAALRTLRPPAAGS